MSGGGEGRGGEGREREGRGLGCIAVARYVGEGVGTLCVTRLCCVPSW